MAHSPCVGITFTRLEHWASFPASSLLCVPRFQFRVAKNLGFSSSSKHLRGFHPVRHSHSARDGEDARCSGPLPGQLMLKSVQLLLCAVDSVAS